MSFETNEIKGFDDFYYRQKFFWTGIGRELLPNYNYCIKTNPICQYQFVIIVFPLLLEIHFSSSPFSTYNDASILKDGNPVLCIIS